VRLACRVGHVIEIGERGLELCVIWEWNDGARITYQTMDRQLRKTGPLIYIDAHMTHALTREGFFWLYDSEESEKVRHLGG
jgi:hypothetical protein